MARKAAAGTVKIDGLRPVMKRLRKLPPKLQRAVLRPATTKAATPVVKLGKKLCPVGDGLKPSGAQRPHLKDTIKKTRAKVAKNGTVYVVAGPEAKKAPHDHLVELGTKPHDIVLGKMLWLSKGNILPPGTVIKHPGSQGVHFMSKAAILSRTKSTETMRKSILSGIDKQVAKLRASK